MKIEPKIPTFDSDGYPTGTTEDEISGWPYNDSVGWFEYIRKAFNHHYGRIWFEPGNGFTLMKISTGGWSGNESIVTAMKSNQMLWCMHWESIHRGGLIVLSIPNKPTD